MRKTIICLILLTFIIWAVCVVCSGCAFIHKTKTVTSQTKDSIVTIKTDSARVQSTNDISTDLQLSNFELEITYADSAGEVIQKEPQMPDGTPKFSNATINNLHELVRAITPKGQKVSAVNLKIGSLNKKTDEHNKVDSSGSNSQKDVATHQQNDKTETTKKVFRPSMGMVIGCCIILLLVIAAIIYRLKRKVTPL